MDLILHHYDESPYAEKIRLVLGLKRLHWRSVIVPMVLPKPMLMPLTGGFRRTPVLQIGADVYCDTLRIAAELDRRFPEPAVLDAATEGASNILGTWAERVLMWPSARYVTGMNRDALSPQFFADRSAMRGHAAPSMAQVERALPHQRRQLELMLGWIENLLADGRPFLINERVLLGDLAVYQRLWWLGALHGKAASTLDPYPCIKAWMQRVAAPGHGTRSEMSAQDALAIAREGEPSPLPVGSDDDDPAPGTQVAVVTEDFGADPVRGSVVRATAQEITIRREDPQLGTIHVHFPRLGYEVRVLPRTRGAR
jgi:glutathione S-transferase